jgi:hypothetical protein
VLDNPALITELVLDQALKSIEVTFDTSKWAQSYGLEIVSNQQEIIDTVCDPESSYVSVLAARGSGKTRAVSLGIVKLCLENPGYEAIVFGPKAEQANRIIGEITKICKGSSLGDEIDWTRCSRTKFYFKNLSSIIALSASEMSEMEGWHGDLGVLDEAHRISDIVWRQRIIPMFTSSQHPKLVKIGISMYRNHFYESCHSDQWTHLAYPWSECPWLFRSGSVDIGGVTYPSRIIDQMPLSYKVARFPNNPELHFPSISGQDEIDFDTQYDMKWVEDVNLLLKLPDQEKIYGQHHPIQQGNDKEEYYFGLDFAGGAQNNLTKRTDFTALVILRKSWQGIKEVVDAHEWQGDVSDQINEILQLIHPEYGVFKCKFGLADYGNLGAAIVDVFKKVGLPVGGIRFGATEANSGKNWKNAIFDQAVFELKHDRFKYPHKDHIMKHAVFRKHVNEWFAIERRRQRGINDEIKAPTDLHDDGPCAGALAIWACDRFSDTKGVNKNKTHKFPKLVFGSTTYHNKGQGQRTAWNWTNHNKPDEH